MRYLEFYTLHRSGSHAILNWIFNQFPKQVLFFNNAIPFEDPLFRMRNPDLDLQNMVSLMEFWRFPETRNEFKKEEWFFLSVGFEDNTLLPFDLYRVPAEWLVGRHCQRILFLRDFYNWFASHKQHHLKRRRSINIEHDINLWTHHAENAIARPGNLHVILYNKWVQSKKYRQDICSQLDIILVNDDTSFISKSGGGSSFDARRYQGQSHKMNVLDRWKILSPEEISIIESDKKLLGLNKVIFDLDCPWRNQ